MGLVVGIIGIGLGVVMNGLARVRSQVKERGARPIVCGCWFRCIGLVAVARIFGFVFRVGLPGDVTARGLSRRARRSPGRCVSRE